MKKFLVATVCLLMAANVSRAQSWGEMCEWVKDYGWRTIASMGHPNDDVVSHYVEYNSSMVKVTIVYHDCIPFFGIGDYTCKYEVRKGTNEGITFFRTIAVPVEGYKASPSFVWWSNNLVSEDTYEGYSSSGLSALYGVGQWYQLSLNQKAAVILFKEFLEYYLD